MRTQLSRLSAALSALPAWVPDVALASLLFAIGASQLIDGAAGPGRGPMRAPSAHVALLGLASLALVIRSRSALGALAGVTVFGSLYWVVEPRQLALLPIVLLVLYGAVANSDLSRVQAWAVAGGAGLVLAAALVSGGRPGADPIQTAILMSLAGAVLVGDSTRSRRALIVEAERRAHEAERSREEHALRRVSEERLDIARELHDVVAHNIALINVQAGVAAHLRERDPERVQEAFETIKRVSHSTLEEMRALVGVLREPAEGASVVPTAGLHALDQLVRSVRETGVDVRLTVDGERVDVPSTVDVSAYRILQEALTNAVRYGDGSSIAVAVGYREDALELEVENAISSARTEQGSGHGIEGMRERVAALGGRFSARELGGRFAIRAVLPWSVTAS